MEIVSRATDDEQYSQLEVNRDAEYPEALYPQQGHFPENKAGRKYQNQSPQQSVWRRKWIWAVLATIMIIAAVIGGVVGGVLGGKHHSIKGYVSSLKIST